MEKFTSAKMQKFREYRTKALGGISQKLVDVGVSANMITTLSLVSGLLAVYFLFVNHMYFSLFVLLHLLFDALDGVIARLTKETIAGKYYDLISDTLITILAIAKVGWFLQDYYAYIVAGLFTFAALIHFWSRLEAPIMFMRTVTLVYLITLENTKTALIAGYLLAGVFTMYSLAKQLQWWMKHVR